MIRIYSALFLAALIATPAQAVGEKGGFADAPFSIGGRLGAALPLGPEVIGGRGSQSAAYGARLRLNVHKKWDAMIDYDGIDLKGGMRVDAFNFGAVWRPRGRKPAEPYVLLALSGIGLDDFPDSNGQDSTFGFKIGAGIETELRGDLTIAPEIAYLQATKLGNNVHDFHAIIGSLNLNYYFGRKWEKEEPAKTAAAPKDSDGDGVYDSSDNCPTTPSGRKVDAKGCQLDSDGDGVLDYDDKCPSTPKGTHVDAKGCRVIVKGEKVSISLEVEFETAKHEVRTQYHGKIQKVADFMKKYPGTSAEIEGHTDNRGDEGYNVGLSQRRSDSVRQYLIDNFGIEAGRLSAKGYGPSKPIAGNETADGRQKNRRVVATITGNE